MSGPTKTTIAGFSGVAGLFLVLALALGYVSNSYDSSMQAGEFQIQEFTCVSVVDSGKAGGERRDCIVEVLDLSTAWLAQHITDVELGPTRYTIGIEYRDVEP